MTFIDLDLVVSTSDFLTIATSVPDEGRASVGVALASLQLCKEGEQEVHLEEHIPCLTL